MPEYVLVIGNPVDGVRIVGPFPDPEDVDEYAETHERNEEWWMVTLELPDIA